MASPASRFFSSLRAKRSNLGPSGAAPWIATGPSAPRNDEGREVIIADLKLKLQLLHNGEIAMGPGKAELLDAIEATGSISAAARSMNMSYRRAWLLVDTMNRCFAEPLVETHPGGGKEAGAKVSEAGKRAREAYGALVEMAAAGADGVSLKALRRMLKG